MVRQSPREQQAGFGDKLDLTSRPAVYDQQASRPDVALNHRAVDIRSLAHWCFYNKAKAVCFFIVLIVD